MNTYLIIIPVHNPPISFLENLAAIMLNEESILDKIVIVDDGSTNEVLDKVSDLYPSIKQIRGNGNMWWGGGMSMGMKYAIENNVDVVVWLNHDCLPDKGTISGLVSMAANPGVGAVSAWCYCKDNANFSVNPGFKSFSEIPLEDLNSSDLVEVDGVNGNCVAISIVSVIKTGLPKTDWHPHYADGPYTWLLHKNGYRNYIATSFRSSLEREYDRCVDEMTQSMFWQTSLCKKIKYYFFSFRSKYHFKHKLYDLVVFRGPVVGLMMYPISLINLTLKIITGHVLKFVPLRMKLSYAIRRYSIKFPSESLIRDLTSLNNRSL